MVTRIKSPGLKKRRHKQKRQSRIAWLGVIFCAIVLYGVSSLIDLIPVPEPELNSGRTVQVYNMKTHELMSLDLEQYLVGVVAAEMPASFEPQALRAQAVAARTYTIKHCQEDLRHGENLICTEHSCCQAFIDPRDYVRDGGSWSSVERVRQAVTDTVGQVLVYDWELIVATYFSCAGGLTEDAAAVWGQEVPYLQSVPSPGEEKATYYIDSKTFTAQQFQTALGIRLKGEVSSWFGEVTFTDGGGVKTMEIGGVSYRGTTLRTLLELRSTAFSVSFQDDTVTFHTRGFGHRVGMSQYGANAMAEEGRTYKEILAHYYCGTEIVHYCI